MVAMNEQLKNWKNVRKELNITPEEEAEIQFKEDIVKAIIEAEENNIFTKMGIDKEKYIRNIEKGVNSPQISTLIKLLYPLGYTLKVVPLEKVK